MDTLTSMGATEDEVKELLCYNENHFKISHGASPSFPLPDELFVETWEGYVQEIAQTGSMATLAKYLVQLRFPIQAGMSADPDYLACTRQGAEPSPAAIGTGFQWRDAARCRVVIHATAAGHIPCLIAERREDFVSLVRALARRNEPDPIPDSMGACMVSGYNNWHRIAIQRSRSGCTEDKWPQEFQRIKGQKELYQDRFIILSSGPYSGVKAAALGLEESRWNELSLTIRREHECAHYFSRRVFSSMRNNLLDELIADYFALSAALGSFRADWLLRFFGVEAFPCYRDDARLEYYRRDPHLSDGAFIVLQKLLVAAAWNLQKFDRQCIPGGQHLGMQPEIFMTLAALTLEQIAAENGKGILASGLQDSIRRLAGKRDLSTAGRHVAEPEPCTNNIVISNAGA